MSQEFLLGRILKKEDGIMDFDTLVLQSNEVASFYNKLMAV